MARIEDRQIPDNKNIVVALTYICGIGKSTSEKILKTCNIPFNARNLNDKQIADITFAIKEKKILIEKELKNQVEKDIDAKVRLGTYQGLRLVRKPNPLPVHGQRTRHNARTAKKGGTGKRKVIAVAGKKKAPTPK